MSAITYSRGTSERAQVIAEASINGEIKRASGRTESAAKANLIALVELSVRGMRASTSGSMFAPPFEAWLAAQ